MFICAQRANSRGANVKLAKLVNDMFPDTQNAWRDGGTYHQKTSCFNSLMTNEMDYQFPQQLFPTFYNSGPPDSALKHCAGSWGSYDRVRPQVGRLTAVSFPPWGRHFLLRMWSMSSVFSYCYCCGFRAVPVLSPAGPVHRDIRSEERRGVTQNRYQFLFCPLDTVSPWHTVASFHRGPFRRRCEFL